MSFNHFIHINIVRFLCITCVTICAIHSHRSLPDALSTSPNLLREDIKRLKLLELQLKDEVKTLAHQRDGLVMELQQLQEAKPVLEKAYAVCALVTMMTL